jgi:hypothetical protein
VKLAASLSFRCFLLLLLLVGFPKQELMGQAQTVGKWSTLPYTMPINPIHVTLLRTGKILVVAGSGNCPPSQSGCPLGPPYGTGNGSGALLLDPTNPNITRFSTAWDMFCNGMVTLPDGRGFINGGSIQYDPFFGQPKSSIFDPSTNTFTDVSNMAHGRWYPTLTTLGDGRIMTFSGSDENGSTNTTVEIYTVGSGWSTAYTANWTPPLYPRLHLLPNGKVFYSGSTNQSRMFDPSSHNWSNVATTIYGGTRTYGSSVLLPLTPDNNYDPQVFIMGGDSPATATTEVIDLGASNPSWRQGPIMSQPRIEMNAVILPSGKVLALGGSAFDEDTSSLSLNADLYDPGSNSFSSAGANSFERLYHSVALLLPDATVWVAGGNPARGTYESHIEIYQPAYLFQSNGSLATRPSITSAPGSIGYGQQFTVQTPDAGDISSAVLIRNAASTHSFSMDQRMVGMSFTAGSGSLTITAPPNGNIAPPGYYMLFLVNSEGVPSVSRSVLVTNSVTAPAPTVSSISPSAGTTNGGTGVTITGTGFQSGATVKLGGTSATGVTVQSGTSITATTPAHSAGAVNVVVTNTDSQSGTLTQGFTYNNPAPTLSSISPNLGPPAGGTPVTISGTGFLSGATATLGGTPATGVTVVSSTSISAIAPAHAAGSVNVVVTNSDGQSAALSGGFTYVTPVNPNPTVSAISPNSGPAGGGTAVNITGTGFLSGATVSLGGTAATGVTVVSSTSISATTAAHAAGNVNVVVTNSDGQSGTLSGGFTYAPAPNPAPTVSAITPNIGPSGGGTGVTVTGTGFLAGATLALGGTPATNVNVVSSTSITATTAANAAGAVDVVVTNSDKKGGTFPGGFTYTAPGIGLVVPSGDPSSATVSAGQAATYTLSIQGVGMSGTASLSCSGAPKGATCTVPPSQSFSASAPATFNVTVTTTARTMAALRLSAFTPAAWFLSFGMLGVVVLPGIRNPKRPLKRYLRLAPLTLLLLLASCGGGAGSASSQGPTPNPNGTPAGTYALKVTAVSGNSTQATSLTLVVQ